MTKLTPKQERFCQEMCKPEANQSKAYRVAFNPKGMKAKTIHEKASRLMAEGKIQARIKNIMAPVIEKVRMTKEDWTLGMERWVNGAMKADTRKMYDQFGNPVEIRELGDAEEILVEGFEFCEDYTKVKKADGETDAVPTGYTKKVKFTSRLGPGIKAAIEFGKVMGWYTEKKELSLDATLEELVMGSMKVEEEKP